MSALVSYAGPVAASPAEARDRLARARWQILQVNLALDREPDNPTLITAKHEAEAARQLSIVVAKEHGAY